MCPYYALASGFLTGKHRPGEAAVGARAPRVQRYLDDPRATARLESLRAVARERGATPAQVALAWQLHKPFVTAPIASATSPAQVRELVASVQLELDAEATRRLMRVHAGGRRRGRRGPPGLAARIGLRSRSGVNERFGPTRVHSQRHQWRSRARARHNLS